MEPTGHDASRPPPHEAHRASALLELVFDLASVIAIATAAHGLAPAVEGGHILLGLIGPVFKESIPREELPEALQGAQAKEGCRLFEMDVSGETGEFSWRGLRNRKAYNAIIRRIARVIFTRLDVAEAKHIPAASGRTVFVAESANGLRDARLRLVNDLTQTDHAVLPRPEDLSGGAKGYARAIGAADLAVFLLGSKHGDPPSGTEKPIIDLHLHLRLARAGGRAAAAPCVVDAEMAAGPDRDPARPDRGRSAFRRAGHG